MTRSHIIAAVSCLCVLLAACDGLGGASAPDASEMQKAGRPVAAESAQASPFKVTRQTDTLTYSYFAPAEAMAITDLADRVRADSAGIYSEFEQLAKAGKADAETGGYPFRPYDLSKTWSLTADTPRLLSMTAEISTFTGGAHGNQGFAVIIWDKRAGSEIEIDSLFKSRAALEAAVRERYCTRLNTERSERRGEQVPLDSVDSFDACPPFSDLQIALFSGSGETIERIVFLAAPYVAGPYAEGSYEISLEVDDAVRQALDPAWRDAFS